MDMKKTIETLTLCVRNGWTNEISKSINEDGSECDLLNQESYTKKFGINYHSITLKRIIYPTDSFAKILPDTTKGWKVIVEKIDKVNTSLISMNDFYEPNGYIQAIKYTIEQIADIEGYYIKKLAEKNVA